MEDGRDGAGVQRSTLGGKGGVPPPPTARRTGIHGGVAGKSGTDQLGHLHGNATYCVFKGRLGKTWLLFYLVVYRGNGSRRKSLCTSRCADLLTWIQ